MDNRNVRRLLEGWGYAVPVTVPVTEAYSSELMPDEERMLLLDRIRRIRRQLRLV